MVDGRGLNVIRACNVSRVVSRDLWSDGERSYWAGIRSDRAVVILEPLASTLHCVSPCRHQPPILPKTPPPFSQLELEPNLSDKLISTN